MSRACTPSCKSRSQASGQKPFPSHTHSPFTPEPHLSEREIRFRQASTARNTRALRPKYTFRSEMRSTSRCYSSIYHEHPQRRGIRVTSKILRPSRNQEARRFTTRSSYFRLAKGKGNRCERFRLEPWDPCQTSDTSVAPPSRTGVSSKDEREPVGRSRRSLRGTAP